MQTDSAAEGTGCMWGGCFDQSYTAFSESANRRLKIEYYMAGHRAA